jgi:hypothetical protein
MRAVQRLGKQEMRLLLRDLRHGVRDAARSAELRSTAVLMLALCMGTSLTGGGVLMAAGLPIQDRSDPR